ncbi:hypothetical protein NQ314_002240 [Rhamnusium bicolor]|uniref:Uncharacterized protein n=1 Tax=Rhamnusium bicolor TaxID=1586634 RepID=A0AAV8ZQL1_9CUCU|nr:hypothetical protein NQ314_002240 [Rhamnusium bicolor]
MYDLVPINYGYPDNFFFSKMKESNSFKVDDQLEFLQNYVIVRTNYPESKLSELKKKISHFSSDQKTVPKTKKF